MRYINGTRLDDRIVRTDWDAGFIEGRQYGRGKSGGQVITFWAVILSQLYFSKHTVIISCELFCNSTQLKFI